MKKVIQYSTLIILTGFVSFTSCKKGYISHTIQPPHTPATAIDTLKGKEFIFSDLKWTLAGPGAVAEEEIWISLGKRPDLFNGAFRPMEVSIKLNTSTEWISAPNFYLPGVTSNRGYVYVIMYNTEFYVNSYPINFQLLGRTASLRIKFL